MPAARVIRSKSVRPNTQRTSGFPLLPLLQIPSGISFNVQSRDILKKMAKSYNQPEPIVNPYV